LLEDATINDAQAGAATAGASIISVSVVSLPVAALTEGAMQAMLVTSPKAILLQLLVVCAATTGVVIGATQINSQDKEDLSIGTAAAKAEAKNTPSPQPEIRKQFVPAKGAMSANTAKKAANAPAKGAMAAGGAEPGGTEGDGGMDDGMIEVPRRAVAMMEGAFGGGGEPNVSRIVEFRYRLEIAQLAAALPTWEKSPKNEAVLKVLEEPLPMTFAKETPLEFVLKYIRKRTTEKSGRAPIPIYVDPIGLQQAERSLNSTVIIDLEGVPLKTSLRLLLKQLDLAYCVRDGVLIISSVGGIREELAEAARELLGNGNEKVDMQLMGTMGTGGAGMMGGMGGMGGGMR
jgi:hypothetical protein